LRLLIAGAQSKFFHLKEFGECLNEFDVEYKLVQDTDIYDGFPSRKIFNWFESQKKFNDLVKEFKPDAVFVDRQTHFGLAALKANLPLFVHLRGDYWSEIEWAKETIYKSTPKRFALWQWQRISEKCFRESKLILPLCKYLENIVKTHYPEKETYILQSGINSSHWYPFNGMKLKHPCVGLLQGAVIWGKTKEMITLQKVLEAMPDVTFYWVGDGPYRDEILPILSKYENFKWLGAMQYPDKVREYLTEIDVYALVSGIDMSPLTLQEAQLMEKPVVATNVGGIPELMKNNETGFLVEKGDYKGWIDKLSILINDNKKAKQMGEAGRKFVIENFSWEKIVKDFIPILEKFGDR
jgi:hypothetical protein